MPFDLWRPAHTNTNTWVFKLKYLTMVIRLAYGVDVDIRRMSDAVRPGQTETKSVMVAGDGSHEDDYFRHYYAFIAARAAYLFELSRVTIHAKH